MAITPSSSSLQSPPLPEPSNGHAPMAAAGGSGSGGGLISKVGWTKATTLLYYLLGGAFGAADPVKFWRPFGLHISPGSLAAFSGEYKGFLLLGMFIMTYLSLTCTKIAPLRQTAMSALPAGWFMFKSCFSGAFEDVGFHKGVGVAVAVATIAPIGMALRSIGNLDVVAAMFYVPALVVGILGLVRPELVLGPLGVSSFPTVTDEVLWKFQCMTLTLFGMQAYTKLNRKGNATDQMKNVSATWALIVLDMRFLRPIYREAGFGEVYANAFTAAVLILATVLVAT